MAVHQLKCWPVWFEQVVAGRKPFEVRKDDRGFAIGDTLILEEWCPEAEAYTGRRATRTVISVLRPEDHAGVASGHAVLGLGAHVQPDGPWWQATAWRLERREKRA